MTELNVEQLLQTLLSRNNSGAEIFQHIEALIGFGIGIVDFVPFYEI